MGKNLSHNSIQTAFKISDLALQAVTLLIIQRVSNTSYCSYVEHLLPIGSSRIRLLEQTDAQVGSSAHAECLQLLAIRQGPPRATLLGIECSIPLVSPCGTRIEISLVALSQ